MDYTAEISRFIIDNFLFGDKGDLDGDTPLLENGIFDSTGVLELISFLQTNYDINIKDNEIIPENLDSIENINRFLKEKCNDAN